MDNQEHKRCLALFDFDGTLTDRDSFVDFIIFSVGIPRFVFGVLVLSPIIIAYLFKVCPNHQTKEYVLRFFFKGWDITRFDSAAESFSVKRIDKIVRRPVYEKLQWHADNGHTVVIVSASPENYMRSWAQKNEVDVIATGLEIEGTSLTGKLATVNCYGEEKVRRIREEYDLESFDYVYAYGDSRGDLPMLALADEKYFRFKRID